MKGEWVIAVVICSPDVSKRTHRIQLLGTLDGQSASFRLYPEETVVGVFRVTYGD